MLKKMAIFVTIFFPGIVVGIFYQSTKTPESPIGPPRLSPDDKIIEEPSPLYPHPSIHAEYRNVMDWI